MQSGQRKKKKGSNSKLSIKEGKNADDHAQQGVPKITNLFDFIAVSREKNKEESFKKAIQNERSDECGESKKEKEQQGSFEEEPLEKQQQQEGEAELNKVTGEDHLSNNSDRVLNDNDANRGSKLLMRNEIDGNYLSFQGIPRNKKFRSISNLYEHTTRLSPVEAEYNWNLPRGNDSSEDSNMNRKKKEDSSNKKNSGGKRKC